MIVPLISIVWLVALVALVARLATRSARRVPVTQGRSPRLLGDEHASFEQAIGEVPATRSADSSEPAAAEHVRDGAQEDLYVGPQRPVGDV
jgi:hypothetical protein